MLKIPSTHVRFDVDPAWRGLFPDAGAAAAVIEREPNAVLHHGERSRVTLLEHGGERLVVKHCLLEQASRRRRLASLGRPAEGLRAFRTMRRLRDAGVRVPEAVFGLERRHWGLASDSWHAYRFVDGKVATVDDAPSLVRALGALHARGWVHRDPHVGNFLLQGGQVLLLDCSRARPSRSAYSRAFDLVLLEKCCRGLGHPDPVLPNGGPLIRLARAHSRALVAWRATKRRARSLLRRPRRRIAGGAP